MALVQVLQPQERLSQNVLTGILRVVGAHSGDDGRQGIIHDFNKDPKTAFVLILVVNGQYEVILGAHVHQSHLVVHELLLSIVFQILDEL